MLIEQKRHENSAMSPLLKARESELNNAYEHLKRIEADMNLLIKKEALKTFKSKLYPSLSLEGIERNIRLYYKLKPVTDTINNR